MDLTPSAIGERAEANVLAALVMAGCEAYLPFDGSSRSDLVFGDGDGLHRVQCRTARLQGEVLILRTCSNTANRPRDYRLGGGDGEPIATLPRPVQDR